MLVTQIIVAARAAEVHRPSKETLMARSRKSAIVASLAVAGLVATGCGGGGGDSADGVKAADGSVTLNWSMWASGNAEQKAWQAVADSVTAAHPKIKIKLETSPFNDYFTKMSTRVSSGSAPCIISMQSLRMGQYASGMLPLDELITKNKLDIADYDSSIVEGLSADGKKYALPYDVGPVVMTYNKTRFREAGVPEPRIGWTIEEFESAAKKLTDGAKYGFVGQPLDLWSATTGS
jgi:multiple sugar transport system substrate-binding protein